MRLGADGRRVDVGDTVVQRLHGAERAIDVAGVNRARQAVDDVIVHANRFIEIGDAYHGEHRAKNLLLLHPLTGTNTRQHGGPVEPAGRE